MIRITGIRHLHGITQSSRLALPLSPFTAPPAPTQIRFTRASLIAATARAAATETVTAGVLQAVRLAMTHLLFPFIDDSITDLAFSADLEQLTDNTRTALSGWVGAGACHLYMMSLGYVYRSTGRGLFAKGRVFDIAYGGGPLGPVEIVGAEAKGSLQRQANHASLMRATRDGYEYQVKPHIDTQLNGYDVVHGYAVGTASNLAPKTACLMHVAQTRRPPTHTLIASPGGASPTAPIGKTLALHNFRAVFALMGADGILGAIDAALRGGADQYVPMRRPQSFQITEWRGREYLVSAPLSSPRYSAQPVVPPFGLWTKSAEVFLIGLNEILHTPVSPFQFRFPIPRLEFNLETEIQIDDGGMQFPDGSALLGPQTSPWSERRATWTPDKGLSYL